MALGVLPAIVVTSNVVAASLFLFYDHILTFEEEVELIWSSSLNWVTLLFFFNRYLAVSIRIAHLLFCSNVFGVIPLTTSGCILWQWFQVTTTQILFLDVEILLIARVFAYYDRNKYLLVCLGLLLAANFSTVVVLVAISLPDAYYLPNNIPWAHSGSCIGHGIPLKFSSLWILPLITHSIVSLLIVIKFIRTWSDTKISPPLLTVFIRDHVWAYFLIFAVSLWTMLEWQPPGPRGQIALTWNISVLGFCGSRLILNLRSAAYAGQSEYFDVGPVQDQSSTRETGVSGTALSETSGQ